MKTSKINAFTMWGGIKRLPKGGQRRSVINAMLIDTIGGDFYGN